MFQNLLREQTKEQYIKEIERLFDIIHAEVFPLDTAPTEYSYEVKNACVDYCNIENVPVDWVTPNGQKCRINEEIQKAIQVLEKYNTQAWQILQSQQFADYAEPTHNAVSAKNVEVYYRDTFIQKLRDYGYSVRDAKEIEKTLSNFNPSL